MALRAFAIAMISLYSLSSCGRSPGAKVDKFIKAVELVHAYKYKTMAKFGALANDQSTEKVVSDVTAVFPFSLASRVMPSVGASDNDFSKMIENCEMNTPSTPGNDENKIQYTLSGSKCPLEMSWEKASISKKDDLQTYFSSEYISKSKNEMIAKSRVKNINSAVRLSLKGKLLMTEFTTFAEVVVASSDKADTTLDFSGSGDLEIANDQMELKGVLLADFTINGEYFKYEQEFTPGKATIIKVGGQSLSSEQINVLNGKAVSIVENKN